MYLDGTWVTAGCCTYLCHLWGLCAPDYSKTYTCVQPLSWMCVFSPNICFSIHNNLCVHMQYLGVLLAALTRGIYIACAHRTLCCATGLLRLSLQLMLSLFPPKVYCNVTNCATHTHVFFHIFISAVSLCIYCEGHARTNSSITTRVDVEERQQLSTMEIHGVQTN